MNKTLPYEIMEIIYQESDIDSKLILSKYYYNFRPYKLFVKNNINISKIHFVNKIKKFKVNFNIVLQGLR